MAAINVCVEKESTAFGHCHSLLILVWPPVGRSPIKGYNMSLCVECKTMLNISPEIFEMSFHIVNIVHQCCPTISLVTNMVFSLERQ